MPATTNVNFRTVVHEKSNGMAMFFPDVCKTPAPPAPFVPIPYPNIAMSTDTDKGSEKVKIDGCPVMLDGSNFKTSTGDEAGSAGGGILSSKNKGKAEFILFSFDVKIEGKGVPRLGDLMLGNKGGSPNTPPMPEIQGPLIMIPSMDQEETAKQWKLKKMETEDPDSEDETEEEGTGGGKAARKGGNAGAASGPGKAEKKKPPTIKAKWSKKEIHPLHNKNETPSSPPTDDIPDECKVKLEVDTTDVPDGTAATIEIRHAHTGAVVKNGAFRTLIVKGNKVVDSKTNSPVEWTMDAESKLWDPWDKPFYFFKSTVDYLDLKAETPKDYKAKEAECLRLVYWSVCASDEEADTHPTRPLTTRVEMADIAAIIEGNSHHKVLRRALKTTDCPNTAQATALWGSVIRNTYIYHQGSHGVVQCEIDKGDYVPDMDGMPHHCIVCNKTDTPKMSVACLPANQSIDSTWVNNKIKIPSAPKYLAYFNTCQTGWEGRFCNSIVKRGTRNVIAFRKTIDDTECVNLAKTFYGTWINTHSGNPSKIPTVFFDVGASCYESLRPVLFGKGGGAIPNPDDFTILEIAAIAIGAIATGLLLGAAAAELIK